MVRSEYEKVEQGDLDEPTGSDDEILPRASGEVRRHEEETLRQEEAAEKLLEDDSAGTGNRLIHRAEDGGAKQDGSRREKGSKARRKGEQREVMFEMEEGGPRSSSAESSGHSSEVDMAKLGETQARRKVWRGGHDEGV